MDWGEHEKLLKAVVFTKASMLLWVPGFPSGSHGEEPRKIPSWLW